jgi:hypothetical protein
MNDPTKLPKWAQQKLTQLQNHIEHLEKEMTHLTGAVPTRVSLHYPGAVIPHERVQFLPEHDSVYFRFGKQHVQVRLHIRDGVRITSSASALHVQPTACNSLNVVPAYDTLEAPDQEEQT